MRATESVNGPAKVLRIGSMVKTLLDEVRPAPLDEKGRVHLPEMYEQSILTLSEGLSPDLVAELERMAPPSTVRRRATLSCASRRPSSWVGSKDCSTGSRRPSCHSRWRTGQLEEMRQRGLPSAGETGPTGAYL